MSMREVACLKIFPIICNLIFMMLELKKLRPAYRIDSKRLRLYLYMATVNDLDFIVSFNFQHIVKRKTMTMTESINI